MDLIRYGLVLTEGINDPKFSTSGYFWITIHLDIFG